MSLSLESLPAICTEFPTEVLGNILSYLGKCDLLNARFICRFWNEESVRVLQKSRFTQTLSDTTIEKYIKFTKEIKASKLILPFYLKFTVHLHDSMRYRHVIRVTLETLTKYVDHLCRIFGRDCVSSLKLTTEDFLCNDGKTFMELGLIQLFHMISPGLKELDLTGFKVHVKIDTPNDFLTHSNLTFPKLRNMICVPYNNHPREMHQAQRLTLTSTSAHILIHIIQNSSNLVDLKILQSCEGLTSWPLRFDKLKTLAVKIVPYPSNIFGKSRQWNSTPVLQELHFLNYMGRRHFSVGDDALLYNILSSVSTTLKTLKVQTTMFRGMFQLPFSKFPHLPHLENLELDCSQSRFCGLGFINYEHMNFNPITLPSLKTVQLPIGTVFTFLDLPCYDTSNVIYRTNFNMEDYMNVTIEFPRINKIIIWMECQNPSLKNYGVGAVKHLIKVFPNASSVCIMNDPQYYGGSKSSQHDVKYLLSQLIQSEWSSHIQEIGLNGFNQDCLGQVLSRLDHPPSLILRNFGGETDLEGVIKRAFLSVMGTMKEMKSIHEFGSSVILQGTNQSSHKMTNIRKVRLGFEDKYARTCETGADAVALETMPNLTAMAKHFPQLEWIEISQDLFFQRSRDLRRGHIQNFMSAFPGVVVDVI